MAEEYDTRPVVDVGRIGERPREQRRHPPALAPGRRFRGDVASVMGIPADHLTPSIQAAIVDLMAEIDHARAELDRHQSHEKRLDDLAHRHFLAPVLNRRGLMRELAKLLSHMAQADLACSLVFIHLGGLERLRVLHGLAADDAAQRHVASAITGAVRQTDIVAGLDSGDFCLVLTLADHAAAETKAEEVAAAINHPPFQWDGQEFPFFVDLGIHDLGADEDGERALLAADHDRRRRDPGFGVKR